MMANSYIDGRGCGLALAILIALAVWLLVIATDYLIRPDEVIIAKDMIPVKRIVTDGVKVDTVLVYKLK